MKKYHMLNRVTTFVLVFVFSVSQIILPVTGLNTAYGAETLNETVEEENNVPAEKETQAQEPKETEAPTKEETEAPAQEETSASTEEETSASVDEETSASTEEETSASIEEETSASIDEETSASVEEETSASVEEETSAPVEEETSAPVEEETSAPAVEETEAPLLEEPLMMSFALDISLPQVTEVGVYFYDGETDPQKLSDLNTAISAAVDSGISEPYIIVAGTQTWDNSKVTTDWSTLGQLHIVGQTVEEVAPVIQLTAKKIGNTTGINMLGNTSISNVTLKGTSVNVFANGFSLELDVDTDSPVKQELNIYGGSATSEVENTNLTLLKGKFANFYGGGFLQDVSGNTNVYMGSDVTLTNQAFGGGYGGTVEGNSTVVIDGKVEGAKAALHIVTAGGLHKDKTNAYVNGTATLEIGESAVIKGGTVFGNYRGQDPSASTNSAEPAVKITVNGKIPDDGSYRAYVSGGMQSGQMNGNVEITIGPSGEVPTIFGASFASSPASITGNVTIDHSGSSDNVYAGGANNSVLTGDAKVIMQSTSKNTGCVYGGATMNGIVNGNTYIDSYSKSVPYITGGGLGSGKSVVTGDTNITLHEDAEASGYVLGGSYNSAPDISSEAGLNPEDRSVPRVEGNVNITLLTGSKTAMIIGGSYHQPYYKGTVIGNEESVTINIDGAKADYVYADGYMDVLPIQGNSEINITGNSHIGYLIGNAEKESDINDKKGSSAVIVNLDNADCKVNNIWYDIDEINLNNSTLTMVLLKDDLTTEDYTQFKEVQNVTLIGSSRLNIERNILVDGDYNAESAQSSILDILAGKKLLIKGAYAGNTTLNISENSSLNAALSQVYVVVQGSSTGDITWSDSSSPVRFDLEGNTTIFGDPANANLTEDELIQHTNQNEASKKWWLVATKNPNPNPKPNPPSGGGGGGNSGGGSSSKPVVTIPTSEVPLASLPIDEVINETVIIDDGEVPLSSLPKTGDRSNSMLALYGLCLSLMALLALNEEKKKNNAK